MLIVLSSVFPFSPLRNFRFKINKSIKKTFFLDENKKLRAFPPSVNVRVFIFRDLYGFFRPGEF